MPIKSGNIPEKNSSQWKKNEKLIAKHPGLRAARDVTEGLKPSSGLSTGVNDEQYKAGYDQIKWNTNNTVKKSYKVKINGRYVDEEEDKQ